MRLKFRNVGHSLRVLLHCLLSSVLCMPFVPIPKILVQKVFANQSVSKNMSISTPRPCRHQQHQSGGCGSASGTVVGVPPRTVHSSLFVLRLCSGSSAPPPPSPPSPFGVTNSSCPGNFYLQPGCRQLLHRHRRRSSPQDNNNIMTSE